MTTYKQWHDEEGTDKPLNHFHNQTQVYFCESNDSKEMSLMDLLRLASNTAVEDYNQRGFSRDNLTEHGFAILVSRQSFRFHRMPKENEKIEITTWEEKPEALQLVRAYEIKSLVSGEKLISGISGWLVVDSKSHRIIPSKKFTLREPFDFNEEHDCIPYGKIHYEDDQLKVFDERIIKYCDIDGNGHTNNARYGDFVSDAIPEDYRHKKITDFRLNYAKEAMLGEKLTVYGTISEDGKKITLVGKTESAVSFEAELYY